MKILVAGDYCPRERIKDRMTRSDFSYFEEVRSITRTCDFSIVNLECPISNRLDLPIEKNGPNLSTSKEVVESLLYGGFNVVTMANNHILDYGESALNQTLEFLNDSNILHVGSGFDIDSAGKPLILEKDNFKIAIINCCENEFSLATINRGGANALDTINVSRQIKQLKSNNLNVIVITHGGHEIYQFPPAEMKKRNRFFIEMGADAVINHHQHVYSGYEVYQGKPIFYGIGNFCFDRKGKRNTSWNMGYMVELVFKVDNNIEFSIIPYNQCSDEPIVKLLPKNSFAEDLGSINDIIQDDIKLTTELNSYYEKQRHQISTVLQPTSNKFLSALTYKGILPLLLSKKTLLRFQNWILCESHRAKLEYFFKNKINND